MCKTFVIWCHCYSSVKLRKLSKMEYCIIKVLIQNYWAILFIKALEMIFNAKGNI